MKLKCLVVDDEPLAREVIISHIEKIEALELVEQCDNALKAFEVLKKEPVDLIFLDIQMPKLNGIEFLKVLNPEAQIIFTTAYREYALESYELNVADYLLKPVSFHRFLKAVNKVVEVQQEENNAAEPADKLRTDEPHIFLKADRKMVKVYLKDILYIESLKDYVRIKLPGREVISLQKISFLEEKLPEDCFIRVHRSFIVPFKKIEAFSNHAVEVNGVEIPIGRNYKEQVLEQLNSSKSIIS
ncbi:MULTISPECIES: LytR/AlgR family response regulator transcription factor [Roseivirga]|jgi:DNA-binding LytR/AlgR family response regulator|uniref:LytR/AlgR family response regulator transcription factor n=1 Tax=Roseivirga TaxID=290180 RepID=UPI00257C94AC|nr:MULTISPECIES: LytTR family DNA-binding domain-containing protein [Roseivirga]MEC7755559.1 LytTR family DNA-binding domain-containing protein [Bacteroidota bacterium]|tara:strand:+ start:711 stop:1439 length:729 start_codon:yes stop_codon:yes gene_type:complete